MAKNKNNPATNKTSNGNDEANNGGNKIERKISFAINTLTTEIKRRNAKEEENAPAKRRREIWTIGSMIAAALFTLALAVASIWQTSAFIQSERAFAYISPDTLSPRPLVSNQLAVVGISVHNTGKTEAVITGINVTFDIKSELPPVPKYGPTPHAGIPGQIGANTSFNGVMHPLAANGRPATISTSDVSDVVAGTKHIYVYGWISFEDIFSFFGPRKIGFCGIYGPENPEGSAFFNCGNSAYTFVR